MKRKTAKEILTESFRELAENKSIDRITIKEITDNCGYSTATFYRQFKDKYDLIAWDHTRNVANIMSRIGINGSTWEQSLIAGAKHFEKEKDYLANLLLHTKGHDSFVCYMTEINFDALKRYVQKAPGKEKLDLRTEMYVRIYCLGTVAITCEWILGKYKVGAEELAEIYKNALPAPLYPYLY